MKNRIMVICAVITASLFLLPHTGDAHTQSTLAQAADKLYQAQNWEAAAQAYETLTKADPTKGQSWYRLGISLTALGTYPQAVEALQKSVTIGHRPEAMYALARAYSLMKDSNHAFEWLTKAVENNLPAPRRIKADPIMAVLRDDPRAKELLGLIEQKARICMNIPQYRQFDFWVGDWDVFDPSGKQVGTNKVVLLQDGCIVEENWANTGGGTGQSFNFYNPILKKWHQSYMDNIGSNWMMDGEFNAGVLRYEGAIYAPNSKVLVKMTFTNLGPDKVRQTAETSSDDGHTWTPVWDGLYVRRK